MTDEATPNLQQLDPVVVEALNSITQRVYHRRGPRLDDQFRRYYSMLDGHSRDYTISAFTHLRHGGFDFPPFLVRRWATEHSWRKDDAQLLDDYAAGVLAGVRYHHADPCGRFALDTWRSAAEGKPPWQDPGRPARGAAFVRRDE
jgi:hypothetical protein